MYYQIKSIKLGNGFGPRQGRELDKGRLFEPFEVKRSSKVALLGKTVVENLFSDRDSVAQSIRIKRVPFVVIGVLTPKEQTGPGRDQDDVVMIPLPTAKKRVR